MGTDGEFPTPSAAGSRGQAAVEAIGSTTVVHVSGEIDMTSRDAVERSLNRVIDGRPDAVVVDLTDVAFFGSSGLQMLVEVRRRAQELGVSLRLVANTRKVLRPLEITGMTSVFPVRQTVAEAVSG
jgi:anti-anti-sigma factor